MKILKEGEKFIIPYDPRLFILINATREFHEYIATCMRETNTGTVIVDTKNWCADMMDEIMELGPSDDITLSRMGLMKLTVCSLAVVLFMKEFLEGKTTGVLPPVFPSLEEGYNFVDVTIDLKEATLEVLDIPFKEMVVEIVAYS
jgi:hypothetical protein